jgi:hypothetical protein
VGSFGRLYEAVGWPQVGVIIGSIPSSPCGVLAAPRVEGIIGAIPSSPGGVFREVMGGPWAPPIVEGIISVIPSSPCGVFQEVMGGSWATPRVERIIGAIPSSPGEVFWELLGMFLDAPILGIPELSLRLGFATDASVCAFLHLGHRKNDSMLGFKVELHTQLWKLFSVSEFVLSMRIRLTSLSTNRCFSEYDSRASHKSVMLQNLIQHSLINYACFRI